MKNRLRNTYFCYICRKQCKHKILFSSKFYIKIKCCKCGFEKQRINSRWREKLMRSQGIYTIFLIQDGSVMEKSRYLIGESVERLGNITLIGENESEIFDYLLTIEVKK